MQGGTLLARRYIVLGIMLCAEPSNHLEDKLSDLDLQRQPRRTSGVDRCKYMRFEEMRSEMIAS